MKKSIVGFTMGIAISFLFAFSVVKYQPSVATAEVINVNGFHIFTDSKPVMPYDSLGVVGLGFVSSTQYEAIRKNLIKRARERFPDANGLILKLDKNGLDNATVVKFQ